MKGSIRKRKDTGWWTVIWYDPAIRRGREISRYKGERMYHKKIAEKQLAVMQSDFENGTFRMEKYTGKGWTDVIEYFQDFLKLKEKKKPATYKGYKSYFTCWIKPFLKKHPIMLHEIQLDTLYKLFDSIDLSGKGKHNVMMCFRSFMDFAWRSNRITEIPPFPKREDYDIVQPTIKWLSEDRQMEIINAIPEEHRPIFLWLKYHLRRPAEACSLHKVDYDPFSNVFIIRRSISARKLVESTKTGVEHPIPCVSEFTETAKRLLRENVFSPFFFINPRAKKLGKRYTNESLNIIWKQACGTVGEDIDLYSGLKHSSCSQYVNEKGLSLSELQIITDHKRLDSVKRYAKVEVTHKRALMERGKVVEYNKYTTDNI